MNWDPNDEVQYPVSYEACQSFRNCKHEASIALASFNHICAMFNDESRKGFAESVEIPKFKQSMEYRITECARFIHFYDAACVLQHNAAIVNANKFEDE